MKFSAVARITPVVRSDKIRLNFSLDKEEVARTGDIKCQGKAEALKLERTKSVNLLCRSVVRFAAVVELIA